MKWMDLMVNVTLADDKQMQHVCEIQIVHAKMLVARKSLGGHKPYAQLRAASEILEVLAHAQGELGPQASKWSLKKLLTSSQKIALKSQKNAHLVVEEQAEEPAAAANARKCPSPPPPPGPPPAPEWTTHITEEGHTYYANETTGVTQWEIPASMAVLAPAVVAPAPLASTDWNDNPLQHAKI